MDCRQFRKQHAQFIDDTLSGVTTWAMRDHVSHCAGCARLDAQLRRALLMARNAPLVEPSPEFQRRLAARIAAERLNRNAPVRRWTSRVPRAIAAGLVVTVGLGVGVRVAAGTAAPAPVAIAPVVVSPPKLPSEPVAAPAMFATVSSSLPVYAAMLLAQRATEQFAATHARSVSFQAEK